MSNTALTSSARPVASKAKLIAAAVLVAWFSLVFVLGAHGAFTAPPGTPPLPILVGVTTPIGLFLIGLWLSGPFRRFILAADPSFMAGIQAWRFAGLGFLALYAHRVLPGFFAWPAGLGDIVIGMTAPWIAAALIRRPGFAASKSFALWNLLGILDLVVAVGTGALNSALATGIAGEVSTRPMAELPLVLIPAFFVPLFLMLHVAALLQARRPADPSGEEG